MDVALGLLRLAGAGLIGLVAVVHLRVAVDLLCHGPGEIARRRNPANYQPRLTALRVERGGRLRMSTSRTYVGYPEHE